MVKVGCVEDVREIVRLAVASRKPIVPLSVLSLVLCLSGMDKQPKRAGPLKRLALIGRFQDARSCRVRHRETAPRSRSNSLVSALGALAQRCCRYGGCQLVSAQPPVPTLAWDSFRVSTLTIRCGLRQFTVPCLGRTIQTFFGREIIRPSLHFSRSHHVAVASPVHFGSVKLNDCVALVQPNVPRGKRLRQRHLNPG